MDFALNDRSATMPQQNMDTKNSKDLWIQDIYIPDSGVVSSSESVLVSEVGTAAPTVYGNYDDLDLLDLIDQNQFNDINQNFEEMQTQDNEALFYDVMESESKIMQSQIAQNKNAEFIGPPCQMFTNQDKNQQQENPIPKLIPLLCDDDLVVVYQAAEMIYKLSTKEASKNAILNSPDIVIALIRTITACNDFEIGRVAISTLHNISLDTEACRRAVMSAPEMVPTLVRAMTISNDQEIKRQVAKTILNVTSEKEMCQKAILNFPEMVPTLQRVLSNMNDPEIAKLIISILCNISSNKDFCRTAAISFSEMVPFLIQLMSTANDLQFGKKIIEFLLNISLDKETCVIMNTPELVSMLSHMLLQTTDLEITKPVLNILQNVSSEKEGYRNGALSNSETPASMRSMSNISSVNTSVCSSIINGVLPDDEICSSAVVNSVDIIPALVQILLATNDLEIVRAATATLHNISYYAHGRETIFKCGGIPALVKSLGSSSGALVAIHNLLLFKKGSEAAICEAGGLPKMISLLRKDNVKFLTIVTDCLYTLAYGNQNNKQVILESQGPYELVRILKTYHYEKLLWTTTKVLKVLSACSNNKKAIVQAGGMQALGKHLSYAKVASPRLVQTALWTLRNLSDAATEVEGLEELLQSVVSFLSNSDEHVVTCAAGILCNLTCNNQQNKLSVCHAGGIDALIRAIAVARDREIITEPAVCALRHLTSRHCESERAQNEVRICYGVEVIMNLLSPSSGWPLIKAVIGLVRNLALCPVNQDTLREQGAVYHLSNLLKYAYQLQRSKNNGTAGGELSGGVRIEEIIEGSVGALHVLARDEQNKDIIRSQEVIPIFVELLLGYNENIQKVACNILSEFG